MSDTSPYILAAPDSTLPNSRMLLASNGLVTQDTGGEGTYTISTVGNLQTLNATTSPGFLTYDATVNNITTTSLQAGTGISIEAPAGQGGNPSISVVQNSTVQQVNILADEVATAQPSSTLNFVGAGSVSVTAGYSGIDTRNNITISGTVGAPTDSKYILQMPDSNLPNSQALSTLSGVGANSLLKTNTSGVVSVAVSNTDYQAASTNLTSISNVNPTIGTFLIGNGSGFEAFLSNSAGNVLTSNGTGNLPSWQPPSTGNLVWQVNSSANPTLVPFVGYINSVTNAGFVFGSNPAVGDLYAIQGFGHLFSITPPGGSGGLYYLGVQVSTAIIAQDNYAAITLLCVSGGANPSFTVLSTNGDSFFVS